MKRPGLIAVAVSFLFGILLIGILVFFRPPAEVTDPGQYAETLAIWDPKTVAHFPVQIPSNADKVRFSAVEGYMQGGPHIQLRLRLPEQDVAAVESEISRAVATTAPDAGAVPSTDDRNQKRKVVAFFYTDDEPSTLDFQADYRLYVLESTFDGVTAFASRGVAISKTRREVVYWAEAGK